MPRAEQGDLIVLRSEVTAVLEHDGRKGEAASFSFCARKAAMRSLSTGFCDCQWLLSAFPSKTSIGAAARASSAPLSALGWPSNAPTSASGGCAGPKARSQRKPRP